MSDFHGSVTPSAKTAAWQRYSPSLVVSVSEPSSSRRVDSHVQPYRIGSEHWSANAASPASISGRDGTKNERSICAGTSARYCGSSESRLLWSNHSYSRVVRSTGASGFDQERRRWKIG